MRLALLALAATLALAPGIALADSETPSTSNADQRATTYRIVLDDGTVVGSLFALPAATVTLRNHTAPQTQSPSSESRSANPLDDPHVLTSAQFEAALESMRNPGFPPANVGP